MTIINLFAFINLAEQILLQVNLHIIQDEIEVSLEGGIDELKRKYFLSAIIHEE